MLRVRTIYVGAATAAAEYYTRYLTQAPGEAPGVWHGAQAAGLGLTGEVGAEKLLAVLEGRDPGSGASLGRQLRDRTLADGTVVKAVAGFDATFSAPKSLSVLWALTRDDRLLAAHDVAVHAALAHLGRFGSTTRVRTVGGRRLHPDSQGLTIATFRQTTSRADDPQIHTHCVVSAKVQTADGRWMALDARYLKKYQRVMGGLYQSVLRNELTHRFGIAWGTIEHGQAEMTAMPADLLAAFSKRTDQIDGALTAKIADFTERSGRDPNQWELGALKREAAVDTRAHKTGNGVADLTTRWDHEAAALGWSGRDLAEAFASQRVERDERPAAISVDSLIDSLSASGSTWSRAQIIGALADVARPDPALSGQQWAARLESWADAVAERSTELDPVASDAPRRASDGRSLWCEPISPHITTEAILAEEETVLSWALTAQADDEQPSLTVRVDGLDALQADVARAVAGDDRLVLVVGPAGAGKTTTLRAAIDDLHEQGRHVFGVAPSAKAARVLETETGARSDTLAKLLHEWHRTDRGQLPFFRLPAGTTVIVDEAGMVGTASLAALVRLADQQGWRLALVGDPHQLQAVGRGGMFDELCSNGRAHELTRIHRFTQPWEAAASLQLRRGDPRALDAYEAHGRIVAGTFDDLLTVIVDRWRTAVADRGTCAITASSNAHVDTINAAIQSARVQGDEIDGSRSAAISGGEQACIGDVVVTRCNDRSLTTSTGESVRNREAWTVTAIDADGSLTVSSNRGPGTVTLPPEYAHEHVRLGYAATEHGNQGDTTTIGMELVSEATTRRGLYVGATRGREHNLLLVVTETSDITEARDVLERVLTNDHPDLPAVAQRRLLAREAGQGVRREQPREPARDVAATPSITPEPDEVAVLRRRLVDAQQRRDVAAKAHEPHRLAVAAAEEQLQTAKEAMWSANHRRSAGVSGSPLKRRRLQRDFDAACVDVSAASAHLTTVQAAGAPTRQLLVQAERDLETLTRDLDRVIRAATPTAEFDASVQVEIPHADLGDLGATSARSQGIDLGL